MTHAARLIILAVAIGLLPANARAFHEHGVANCGGCHVIHNSQNDQPINPDSPYGSELLLKYESTTDLCLSCHATAYGAVLGSDPLNPPPEKGAGNFVFLFEDNINDADDGLLVPIAGNHAGHNVVSPAYNIPIDPNYTTSPGGTYPSSSLSCTSCHDPHGNSNFRMLRGRGTESKTGFTFRFNAPVGDGVDVESGVESPTNHTAYDQGWSNWCANCHSMYHQQALFSNFDHPVSQSLNAETRDSYNAYNGPDDPTGGDIATAYIPEVPIEGRGITVTTTSGATTAMQVSCMTCHRAHATSAPEALRWDPNVAVLGSDGAVSGSYAIPSPYGPTQRSLCVKCHYPESTQHGQGQACMDCHRDL